MNQKLILTLFVFFIFLNSNFSQKKEESHTLVQLDSILDKLRMEGAYDKLLPYAEIAVNKAKESLGTQDTIYAKMLYFFGFACQMQQRYEEGERALSEAIEIQSKKIPKHQDYAASLHNLAFLHHSLGRYDKAKPLYEKAMQIRKEVLGMKHPDYAKSLNNLAALYWYSGEYNKVLPLYKEVLQIRKEVLGTNHLDYIGSLNNLAVLYMEMGRYIEAERLYKEVLVTRKALLGTEDARYSSALRNLGTLYSKIGRYEEAEHLYKEALATEQRNERSQTLSYVDDLISMTSFYINNNNLNLADSFCREGIRISKAVLGGNHPGYIKTLANLALINSRKKNYEESEKIYKELIIATKETFGPKHKDHALILNNLGYLYWKTEKYEKAEQFYKEALAISSDILDGELELNLMVLNNIATLYKTTKRYDESLNCILKSIFLNTKVKLDGGIDREIAQKILDANYISMSQLFISLSNYYVIFDNLPTSEKKLKQTITTELALQILERNRLSFVGELDKLRNLENNSEWVLLALQVLDKNTQVEQAFGIAEQGKSVLLLDAVKTNYAYTFGELPDSLVQEERLLQADYTRLQVALIQEKSELGKEKISVEFNELNKKVKNFQELIQNQYPKYAALRYQVKESKIKEIQETLDSKTALIEYLIADSAVHLFYIDKNSSTWSEFAISKKELMSKIKEFHEVLSNYKFVNETGGVSYTQYTQNAYWLYQNLLEPVLKKVSNIEHLIIIPDGELGHLPFEAFLMKQAPQANTDYAKLHYLIKDYSVSYNYSATLLIESKRNLEYRKKNLSADFRAGEFLAMAGTYHPKAAEKDVPTLERIRKTLIPLPSAEQEVALLGASFQGFFAFDTMASEKIFKEKAQNYAIIHLAMHGILDNKTPLLSSMVFTDDGDSIENNFLQAHEISKMNLNADLVVLSACETGYGRFETGNGIASLARAFMYAGATSLVVSLWQVNDYSTAEIMQRFYKNLSTGMSKDAALRQAKLDYLKIAQGIVAHPTFWSPFILIGSDEPVYIKMKGDILPWIIGSVVLFIGFIFIVIIMKKKKKESIVV